MAASDVTVATYAAGVHLGPGSQIVHGAHGIPALDAGRGVAVRVPPPPPFVQQPSMQAGNFAQFERVNSQRDVAVRREPYAVTLAIGGGLVAFTPVAVVMAALIQDRRVAPWRRRPGQIEIGRDV